MATLEQEKTQAQREERAYDEKILETDNIKESYTKALS